MKRSVLISLILMAVSNLAFAGLASAGHNNWAMAGAVGFEGVASVLATLDQGLAAPGGGRAGGSSSALPAASKFPELRLEAGRDRPNDRGA